MIFKKTMVAAVMTLLTGPVANFAHAQTEAPASAKGDSTAQTTQSAQDQLKTTFTGMTITDFKESPVKGLYEVKTGSNIIYFHPGEDGKKGVLLIGEMYDSSGVNLTEQSKFAGISATLNKLPLDTAITIGPKDAPTFYEFTDPDCPYCHAYDEWMKDFSKDHPVQRKLIFMVNPGHPLARAKIEHVICSDNKDEAVRYVYSSELPHNPDGADAMQLAKQKALKTCKEADAVIEQHAQILKALGVNGTPSFLFGVDSTPNLIVGYQQQKIAAAITDLEKPAVTKLEKPTAKASK